MHGSSKIPSKKCLVVQHCAEGFNSGIKGLNLKAYSGRNKFLGFTQISRIAGKLKA
jgi:hypothetical protein